MDKIKTKLASFMNGRYGYDKLGRLILAVSIICFVLSFFGVRILYYAGIGLLAICYFRIFSRNITKRDNENRLYNRFNGRIAAKINKTKRRISERKTHCFFKCRTCSQTIRIPKGKGNICISCPKCRSEFQAKT